MGAAEPRTTSEPPTGIKSSGYSSDREREGFIAAPLDDERENDARDIGLTNVGEKNERARIFFVRVATSILKKKKKRKKNVFLLFSTRQGRARSQRSTQGGPQDGQSSMSLIQNGLKIFYS